MRNAQEVIAAIHAARISGNKVGLQNIRALMEALNLVSDVPAIHVAGTNGKGSVCAMTESVLRHAGYRTGLYTSPFLQVYNERIRLNDRPVSDQLLEQYGNEVLDAAEGLAPKGIQPTSFELGTALALRIFQAQKVDVMVIEVGIGGRFDPTNAILPLVSVITAIGLDHMQILGDTLEKIAFEKAGIIKEHVPVVCHPAEACVAEVFRRRSEELEAPLFQLRGEQITDIRSDRYGSDACYRLQSCYDNIHTPLPGEHQLTNTLTVLGAIEALRLRGWSIPREAVDTGIAQVVWPARLEWHGSILMDGGHNAQGIAALQSYVQTWLKDTRRVMITGMLEDHLQPDMLCSLASLADEIITVTPDSPRAMTAQQLAEQLLAIGKPARAADTMGDALALARSAAGSDGVILAAGSLYLAGALRTELGLPWC